MLKATKLSVVGPHQHTVWVHSPRGLTPYTPASISQDLVGSLNAFSPFKIKSHYILTEIMFSPNNYILQSSVENSTGFIFKTPKETVNSLDYPFISSEELP